MSGALNRLEKRVDDLEKRIRALENPSMSMVLFRRLLALVGLAIAYWKAREG